jgi:myo-inositol-1-phosphate synthase
MAHSALVAVVGLNGAVGSTFAAGLCLPADESTTFGMATESPCVRALGLNLLPLKAMSLDGWDLGEENVFSACARHGICSDRILAQAERQLRTIVPRRGAEGRMRTLGDWIHREAEYLLNRKAREHLDHIVIVNLCPTEAKERAGSDLDWADLRRLRAAARVPISRIYFRLAIEAGAHFVNFTPNHAEVSALRALAEEAGLLYVGRDGKTGQTFLKTTLAPAFRDKNLRIDGWFSTNLLGNADGLSLAGTEAGKAKIESKTKCLSSIMGYVPGGEGTSGHQVHIHYYPPRGDAKEAWDSIDFSGFLGVRMQMKINWLGQDSILAAPAVADLVRITTLAAQAGRRGPLSAASYFFKDPIVSDGLSAQHGVPDQFRMLLDFLRDGAP